MKNAANSELNRVPSIPVTSNFRMVNFASTTRCANVAQLAREHGVDNNLILSGYASGRRGVNLSSMPATIVGPVVPPSLPGFSDSVVRRVINDPLPAARRTLCVRSPPLTYQRHFCHVEFRHGKMTLENPSSGVADCADDPQTDRGGTP